jgi:hypothetical protein
VEDVRRSEGVPNSRLAVIADSMLNTLEDYQETEPENRIEAVVMLSDNEKCTVAFRGFKDDSEAIAAILMHLEAVLRANGKQMHILTSEDLIGEG